MLTPNARTPSTSDGPWPVLFSVHGGARTFGSSAQPDHDGAALAVLDQRAALRWVREHIGVFGGDPDDDTVGGQSAGAGSALFLAAWEPVRRVIAHSVPNRFYTPAFARRVVEWIDTSTPGSTVASTDALAAAQRTGPLAYDPLLFGPVAAGLPALLFSAVGTVRSPGLRGFGRARDIPDHVVAATRTSRTRRCGSRATSCSASPPPGWPRRTAGRSWRGSPGRPPGTPLTCRSRPATSTGRARRTGSA
ncbi:carboxylesterase family protein [Saccharothrix isguenensis]